MSSYLISWKPGVRATDERHLTVQAADMVQAAMVADSQIFFAHPHYMLTGIQLINPPPAPKP